MSEVKHTPGPWRTFNCTDVFPDDGDTTGSRHIACCDPVDDAIDYQERCANAHLIAAAPDLLEALKSAPGDSAHMNEWDAWRATVAALIAKAEGNA